MIEYQFKHDGKKYTFTGPDVNLSDVNVHTLMQKVKRLKIGVEECTESKKSTSKTATKKQKQS